MGASDKDDTMKSPVIEVKNFWWQYEGSIDWALKDINLEIFKGEFLGIMGRTGAGKSTLCNSMMGITAHRIPGRMKGYIRVFGMDTRSTSIYKIAEKVGIVFQDPETQFIMTTVEDEIALALENKGLPREEIQSRILEALEFVDLDEKYLEKSPLELSGGEKQKVAIAAVLALRPEILILDEPTSDLDPMGKSMVFSVIEKLRHVQKMTIVMVSHESERIAQYANRIVILDNGRIVMEGDPREIFKDIEKVKSYGVRPPQVAELYKILTGKDDIPLTVDEAISKIPTIGKTPSDKECIARKDPIIEVQHVSYTYPDGTAALKDVSLKIYRGDYIALIGPNGSGKTTLAKHLNGILKPTKGRVLVKGMDTSKTSISKLAKVVGYCFQNPDHQLFCRSVREELEFGLKNIGLPESEIAKRVDAMLKKMNLETFKDEHPFFLSKGQRQRLAVASIMVMEPEIIVVDEPTTGQDYQMIIEMMNFLDELHRKGKTVIIITHDMNIVAECAKRVIAMLDGRIVADTTPRKLFEDRDLIEKINVEPPQISKLSIKTAGKAVLTIDEYLSLI